MCVCDVVLFVLSYGVVCWSVLSRRLGHSPPVTPQGEDLTENETGDPFPHHAAHRRYDVIHVLLELQYALTKHRGTCSVSNQQMAQIKQGQ